MTIHHWLIKRNVTVVAAAIALPKEMTFLKMRMEILFTDHFDLASIVNLKGPPKRAFFCLTWDK